MEHFLKRGDIYYHTTNLGYFFIATGEPYPLISGDSAMISEALNIKKNYFNIPIPNNWISVGIGLCAHTSEDHSKKKDTIILCNYFELDKNKREFVINSLRSSDPAVRQFCVDMLRSNPA